MTSEDKYRVMTSLKEAERGEHTDRANDRLSAIKKADDVLLAKLGYRSEFRREFSMFESASLAFSVMGLAASIPSSFSFPLPAGGHVGMVWGWIIPCILTMAVAVSLAELVSAMPMSGGLYYFSAKLAPPRWAPLASWITGWANIAGQIAVMCSIDYTCAEFITSAVNVSTDGAIKLGPGPTFGILLSLLFLHGFVCSAATAILARLNPYYVLINVGTTIAVTIALLVCSGEQRVSAKTAFTKFENNTGWANDGWAFLLSFYAAMWTLTGYDSAAHLSEETTGAARTAPIAIILGVSAVTILGWLLSIAASFATTSVPALLATDLPLPMGQLYLDVFGKRGMLAVWSLVTIVQFMAGAAQGVDASRVVFAFARDNALPGSRWWKRIHPWTGTPVNAVWLVMFLSGVCGLLSFSAAALTSLAGASVVGLYISYITPIFLRLTFGRKKFKPGPFSLGRWYLPIGIIAVAWVGFVTVLFVFPPGIHPTEETMNYSVVVIMGVFVFAALSWIFSARKWFTGPIRTIQENDSAEYNDTEKDGAGLAVQVNEREVSASDI